MDDLAVRPARADEAVALGRLALRSKAYWGYDDDFLAACRTALRVDPSWCDGLRVQVAEREGRIQGFFRVAGTAPAGELDALFVDPPAIGAGVGAELLRTACNMARGLGMSGLGLDADPGAEGFYLHAGATRAGSSPSTVEPGRMLPRLHLVV